MKVNFVKWIMGICLVIGLSSGTWAQSESEDKTLSPYFFVKSDSPEVDQLPLKSTSAEVNIAGVIADVNVTQVYQNQGKNTIEAIYIFPASTRASVYGMTMTIGERKIVATVKEREAARQEYEQAKEQGKSASLLEQQRPNVFQMNVANILPGDTIKVELKYTELLVPTDGVYEFVYPTVVGPRYSNQPEATAPGSEKWVKNPYLHEGEAPPYEFGLSVKISGSLPIQDITCTSHKIITSFDGPTLATIKLDPSEKSGGNRDVILKYRLTGNQIESGLLLYEGEKENFFLLMVQPPKRISPEHIPPREYIFIIDVSGSMHGFPIEISKKLLKDLISGLRPSDKFNVLLFSGGSTILSEKSMTASQENIQQAIHVIDQQRGGGGTELLPAMKRALELPEEEGMSRSLVIVTDGYVTVEKEVFDLIRTRIGQANMFSFGIGSSVNRYIIEGMARVGMGEPFIVTKPEEAPQQASKFRQYISTPVLTKAKVEFKEFNVYDVEPPTLPDMFAERPVILFGKWKGEPKGMIRLSGYSGTQLFTKTISVNDYRPLNVNAAIKYLWARHRITLLSDYNMLGQEHDVKKEITALGLTYNLLTPFTSFVAIDTIVRQTDGKTTTVQQPLPLPQGVSDYAVGAPLAMARGSGKLFMTSSAPALTVRESDETMHDKKKIDSPSIDATIVNGLISKEYALEVIKKHLDEIKACYQKTQVTECEIKDKIVLEIVIDGAGNVVSTNVINGSISESFKTCLMDVSKKWKYQASTDGNPSTIRYSISY